MRRYVFGKGLLRHIFHCGEFYEAVTYQYKAIKAEYLNRKVDRDSYSMVSVTGIILSFLRKTQVHELLFVCVNSKA